MTWFFLHYKKGRDRCLQTFDQPLKSVRTKISMMLLAQGKDYINSSFLFIRILFKNFSRRHRVAVCPCYMSTYSWKGDGKRVFGFSVSQMEGPRKRGQRIPHQRNSKRLNKQRENSTEEDKRSMKGKRQNYIITIILLVIVFINQILTLCQSALRTCSHLILTKTLQGR